MTDLSSQDRVAPKIAEAGTLRSWLIEPSASPTDSRWQDRPIWSRVVVAAPSATFARLIAEKWAEAATKQQIGNETPSPLAGFSDEKLYCVRPAPSDAGASGIPLKWPGKVLSAELLREAPDLP